MCTLFDVNFEPTGMSAAELKTGFRDLAEKLYSAEFTQARRERYRQRLRDLRNGSRDLKAVN
ncbi:MAG: DUF4070 domain-containing protein [Verrucomicrobiota bacterium]|nr:DUF4070 domain-containing protein [Verrucomicrobiota bacterium]